jgi:DNA-binding beta-propeller fold protein YncE
MSSMFTEFGHATGVRARADHTAHSHRARRHPRLRGTLVASIALMIAIAVVSAAVGIVPPTYGFTRAWGTLGTGNGQFNTPWAIAVNPTSGNVYVADNYNTRVEEFTATGAFVTKWGTSGSGPGQFTSPIGIAVNPTSGDVYVANSAVGNDTIQEFTSTGAYVTGWSTDVNGEFSCPRGIAINNTSGDVYVVNGCSDANNVQEFTSTGTYLTEWGSLGSGNGQFDQPAAIAVDPASGEVYVLDGLDNRIEIFTGSGAYVTKWPISIFANGIAVTASGDVYDSGWGPSGVLIFTAAGKLVTQFGLFSGLGCYPTTIALNSATGGVYVANGCANRIYEFSLLPPHAPAITRQPANRTLHVGKTATFVVAASGTPTPSVRWQRSTNAGRKWTWIAGATKTTLTVKKVTRRMNGYRYRAVLSNGVGPSARSRAAILKVT